MQNRHLDRKQYFEEESATSKNYYLPYLRRFTNVGKGVRVIEVGCGEGGNLLPFYNDGCHVSGIDFSEGRIEQANTFFRAHGADGDFRSGDFLKAESPKSESEKYDIVLMHDVIEHIPQNLTKPFLTHIQEFMKKDAVFFCAFPAWRMPFGGHQQIGRGFASKLPFIHLLPKLVYRWLLNLSGENDGTIKELFSIRESQMRVECFEHLVKECHFAMKDRVFWFINPHYLQKFGLKPRVLRAPISKIPYVRNFFTTSCFYMLKKAA
jgi:2-polyprenyl-3-methyl-5-hydroxy-6-metoxy-1,4-benzoquinol methylase